MLRSNLLCLLVICTCMSASAGDKPWVEIRSPHFRVLTDGSQGNGRRVAAEFEQMRAVFALQFPGLRLDSGAPLVVLAPRDEISMKALVPKSWRKDFKAVGFFRNGWETRYALVQVDQDIPGAYQVVYHEYVHSLLHANFRWLPGWLDEGLAEFYGNTRFEQSRILIGAPGSRYPALQHGVFIPLDALLESTALHSHDDLKVQMFYAESWGLVHFFMFGPGMDSGKKLNRFNALLQEGVDQKKAFQQVFGETKDVEKAFRLYLSRLAMTAGIINNPSQIDQRGFAARTLTLAETQGELGAYWLRMGQRDTAQSLLEQAVSAEPKLASLHESLGLLKFSNGKDDEARQEFAEACRLDGNRHLSMFYKTMLSSMAQSDAPEDHSAFATARMEVVHVNPQFAPPFIQLAKLDLRQNKLVEALAVSRKAEQLEPSRAGYHILSGEILLRMGRGADAAKSAKYVADRWSGPDHNEAVELWNRVPVAMRPESDPLLISAPPDTQVAEGKIRSLECLNSERSLRLVLDRADGSTSSFTATDKWGSGFSDTLWFGGDYFDHCHHVEGLRALVHYKPSSDSRSAGAIAELEFRDYLPEPAKKVQENTKQPPQGPPVSVLR